MARFSFTCIGCGKSGSSDEPGVATLRQMGAWYISEDRSEAVCGDCVRDVHELADDAVAETLMPFDTAQRIHELSVEEQSVPVQAKSCRLSSSDIGDHRLAGDSIGVPALPGCRCGCGSTEPDAEVDDQIRDLKYQVKRLRAIERNQSVALDEYRERVRALQDEIAHVVAERNKLQREVERGRECGRAHPDETTGYRCVRSKGHLGLHRIAKEKIYATVEWDNDGNLM